MMKDSKECAPSSPFPHPIECEIFTPPPDHCDARSLLALALSRLSLTSLISDFDGGWSNTTSPSGAPATVFCVGVPERDGVSSDTCRFCIFAATSSGASPLV